MARAAIVCKILPTAMALLLAAAPPVAAEERKPPNILEMGADLMFLRPLGLLATAMGTAAYVVTLPLVERESGSLDRTKHTKRRYIDRPWSYTFDRPLGYLEWQEPPQRREQ
ncbi:MAG: hypothetical protein HQL82_01150 [Magnetococcales bacterium]|nr:hypothetical protein [Magnetococcales bacterium]